MGNMTSPNDPVFWLHHCNIDRLWPLWRDQHPTEAVYLPTAGGPTGHNLNDNMIFSAAPPAPWAGSYTPQSVIDHHALGYQYDSELTAHIAERRVRVAPNSVTVNRVRFLRASHAYIAHRLSHFALPVSSETKFPD